jgi:ABC-type phosphate transport system auxiliary subunit
MPPRNRLQRADIPVPPKGGRAMPPRNRLQRADIPVPPKGG